MGAINYFDFDLSIERSGPNLYRARVLNSPAGQAVADFSLPFSELELENFILRMGRMRRGVRRLESPEMDASKQFGGRLFKAVFKDEVQNCLRSSLAQAKEKEAGLRIRLRLTEVPELVNVPWEYLYNPTLNRFLVMSVATPIVRYLDLPERIAPLKIQLPLKVLVMISSPEDYPYLDVEREWKNLQRTLKDLEEQGLVVLERLEKSTPVLLQHKLRQESYHVFHFIGHGSFDDRAQDGILLMENEAGKGRPMSGQYLGTLLHDESTMRLAVLNACEGARSSNTDAFAGVAQSLVQQGLPAVIAMQFEITDETAIVFAREFYAALASGYPIDAALAEARKIIFSSGNDVEWGTPVLYMRVPDGQVFEVEKGEAVNAPEVSESLMRAKQQENQFEPAYKEDIGLPAPPQNLPSQTGQALSRSVNTGQAQIPVLAHTGTASQAFPRASSIGKLSCALLLTGSAVLIVLMLTAVAFILFRGNILGADPNDQAQLSSGIVTVQATPPEAPVLVEATEIEPNLYAMATVDMQATNSTIRATENAAAKATQDARVPETNARIIQTEDLNGKLTETADIEHVFAKNALNTWNLTFMDEFNSQGDHWYFGDVSKTYVTGNTKLSDGSYIWNLVAKSGGFNWVLSVNYEESDFYISVDGELVEGPGPGAYGLIFRFIDGNNFYVFYASKSGSYGALKKEAGQWENLLVGDRTSFIHAGGKNQLAVLGIGAHFAFFINDHLVGTTDDNAFPLGEVGLYSFLPSKDDEGTFSFDNFKLLTP